MRLALKITLNLVMYGVLGVAILIQAFPPVEWQQQPLQLTKVARAMFVVPPKPAKIPKKILSGDELTLVLEWAGWPRKLHGKAARVIFCESGNDAYIVGKKNPMDVGLFQVNIRAHEGKIQGPTVAQKKRNLKNPYTNALIALEVYKESKRFGKSGWRPWKSSVGCHGLV